LCAAVTFLRARVAGDFEGFAGDAVRSFARDHAHGDGDVVVGPKLRQAGDDRFGIEQAFGELAQKHDVYVLVDGWNRGVGERRAHRRKQIEFLAHRRHHPGRFSARIGGVPDRTHDPAVELAQCLFGQRR
jgi:hypothetical protein